MKSTEKERLIKSDIQSIENQVRHAFNQGYDLGYKHGIEKHLKTGHWIDVDGDNAICGCCNRFNRSYGTYCKHCGAKMIELQERSNI